MTQHFPTKRLEMTLSDRLDQEEGWVYMTGMQALVRLPIQQARRDKAAGLNTGGYISGYRGSPVGRYDVDLWQADKILKEHNVVFQPGLNEDMAATAAWGTQLVGHFPGAKVDGVFSIWYGKAPGMDRSMDPLRHANLAGTNPKGGSLLLVGDDHGAKSSTLACYSDLNFASTGIPLLAPCNAQDVLDFGLHGIAMSRSTGTIVGMKLVTDVVEGGGSVQVGINTPAITPLQPRADISIQAYRAILEQEKVLWDIKIDRALEYARLNGLNTISGASKARVGIVAAGKAWQDLRQALATLGHDGDGIGDAPIRLFKPGMIWPLDPKAVLEFADGLDTILVIEEKRGLLEDQIRATLYGSEFSPRIVGKTFSSTTGEVAFPNYGEITPNLVARVIARVVNETNPSYALPVPNEPGSAPRLGGGVARPPSFCAGCPHGRSTQVLDGSRALAGIGCHTMAAFRDPSTTNSISHMGGEGGMWLGQFPFTDEAHVFANMGDGTYNHSGYMAIRAAIAAGAPMTYKLLHNGFVSMTGGQPHDSEISPQMMVKQLKAEGVNRIAVVSDEPEKFTGLDREAGVTVHHRTEKEAVERELRGIPEVTILIYDQPCATERRRLRKRGKWADPDKRVFINSEVCEGCGDCSTVSQCMAIEPLETKLGRKRVINQSSCNKDFSCVEGFCPSFVTVSGAKPRKVKPSAKSFETDHLTAPTIDVVDGSWSILVSGIGGAGVVTVGQTLAVAAHADGYFSSNLDITGLAQKYGAVHSHIKIASDPSQMRATRIADEEADALIGCDLVVAAGDDALSKLRDASAVAVTDTTVVPTGEFSSNPDWSLNGAEQLERLTRTLNDRAVGMDAQSLAEKVMGDRVFANMLLVGASWQQGGIPLSYEALMHAITLNGVAIDKNKKAFELGRLAIAEPQTVAALMGDNPPILLDAHRVETLEEIVAERKRRLMEYGGASLVKRFDDMLARTQAAGLSIEAQKATAKGAYKLLAVKDEWEVARLYARPSFLKELEEAFEGDLKLSFHVGAWPFAKTDKETGKIRKGQVGPWLLQVFRLMNKFRWMRGTVLDPFRNNAEARLNRKALADYEADLAFAEQHADDSAAHEGLTELLNQPEFIRGYGHVREVQIARVNKRREELKARIVDKNAPVAVNDRTNVG
jgi:indolepyruvate ferredoxin oxidoreductase